MVSGLLKDVSFQAAMREGINNAVGELVDNVIKENESLKVEVRKCIGKASAAKSRVAALEAENAEVKKYKSEASAAKDKMAALEAENARLKAGRSSMALKAAAIRLFDKVLVSGTFGDSIDNLALLANKAYGHKIFKLIRRSLSRTDRKYYAKFFKNPGARLVFEETLYNFRRGGLGDMKPSVLDFFETHADLPTVAEIDAYADDVDTKVLGDFVFVESDEDGDDTDEEESSEGEEERDEEERGDEEDKEPENRERQERMPEEMRTGDQQPLVPATNDAVNDGNANQDV